jgi:hypothetical protein
MINEILNSSYRSETNYNLSDVEDSYFVKICEVLRTDTDLYKKIKGKPNEIVDLIKKINKGYNPKNLSEIISDDHILYARCCMKTKTKASV